MRGVPVKVGGVCSATRCRRLPAFLAAVLAFGVCILVAGCRDIARSPDGHWVATARTQQWGGPGTAYDATSVFLKQGSQPPTQILGFSHQYATMNLKMTWVTPAHLEVTYGPSERPGDHVSVDLQVVRIAGVDISLRKLSGESLQ
jgi:hypothetical protein